MGSERRELQYCVVHRVANQVNSRRQSFVLQIAHGNGGWTKEKVGAVIGEHAVVLLGHLTIEGAKPGLDVSERDTQLTGSQRTSQGGIRVAVDQYPVGPLGEEDGFEPD